MLNDSHCTKKMKVFIEAFFSKCHHIRSFPFCIFCAMKFLILECFRHCHISKRCKVTVNEFKKKKKKLICGTLQLTKGRNFVCMCVILQIFLSFSHFSIAFPPITSVTSWEINIYKIHIYFKNSDFHAISWKIPIQNRWTGFWSLPRWYLLVQT